MRSNVNKFLVAIIVLQGLMLLGQWTGQAGTAHARPENLPDPGARQIQMIEELKSVNAKLDRLINVVQSGDVQVRVKEDKK